MREEVDDSVQRGKIIRVKLRGDGSQRDRPRSGEIKRALESGIEHDGIELGVSGDDSMRATSQGWGAKKRVRCPPF